MKTVTRKIKLSNHLTTLFLNFESLILIISNVDCFGKWHLGAAEAFQPNKHGFNKSLWIETESLFLPENAPNVVNAKLPFDPIDKFIWGNKLNL